MIENKIGYRKAHAALKNVERKIVKKQGECGEETEVSILYEGKWRQLGRMDEADEVRSTISQSDEQLFNRDPVGYYKKLILFGAMVTDEDFYVIDSLTDG